MRTRRRSIDRMSSRSFRRLVVDACVARAAGGEDAVFPASRDCRDFLQIMLGLSHHIVKTREIWAEWRKHKSNYARVWLNSMIARKRVYEAAVCVDGSMRAFVVAKGNEKVSEAIQKDCHLIEAARASDSVVVSTDDTARSLFFTASDKVGWLKTIAWVNPTISSETAIDWLKSGATAESVRCLRCKPV
jgi:hypothetical protein